MVRALKTLDGANFLLATVALAGFVGYCLLSGTDIEHGWGIVYQHSRGRATWWLVAFLQLQLLILFMFQRRSERCTTIRHRIGYILFGALVLFMIPLAFKDGRPRLFDLSLVAYIGLTDIIYGLLGDNST